LQPLVLRDDFIWPDARDLLAALKSLRSDARFQHLPVLPCALQILLGR
jgi:hypothetical protein